MVGVWSLSRATRFVPLHSFGDIVGVNHWFFISGILIFILSVITCFYHLMKVIKCKIMDKFLIHDIYDMTLLTVLKFRFSN